MNPAREREQVALDVVRRWVGDRGRVIDDSGRPEPDFRIQYTAGASAIGEVGWAADPLQQEWAHVLKQEKQQQIDLPSGHGSWGSGLTLGVRIKRVEVDHCASRLDTEQQTLELQAPTRKGIRRSC